MLAAVTAQGMEHVARQALRVDADDRRRCVNISHHQGDGGFDPLHRCGDRVVAWLGVVDDALKAENAEVTPSSGKVGVGHFIYCGEGHNSIIRFGAHRYWIVMEVDSMQSRCKTEAMVGGGAYRGKVRV